MPKLKASVLTCWKYCNILYIRQTVLKHSKLWLYIFIITIIIIFDRRSDRAQVNWIQLYITCSSMPRWNHRNPPWSPDSMNKEEEKKEIQRNKTQVFCFPSKVTSALLYIQQPERIAILVLRTDCKNTEQGLQFAGGDHESWKMLHRYRLKKPQGHF